MKPSTAIEILTMFGFVAWRCNAGKVPTKGGWMHLAHKGVSDVFGFHQLTGLIAAVECKTDKDKPRPEQIDFLNKVERVGGMAVVAWTEEDLLNAINAKRIRRMVL